MNTFLANFGFIAIVLLVIYILKKLNDYSIDRKDGVSLKNEKVYNAAEIFSHGANPDRVRGILTSCIDFDDEDVDEILLMSSSHRSDGDGGYGAFLKAVNKVLGIKVYTVSKKLR